MSTKAKANKEPVKAVSSDLKCPAEAILREYVAVYRAHDHIEKLNKEHRAKKDADIMKRPLIGALDDQFLWTQMTPRLHALEEMVRLEQAKSEVGALFQLLLAARISPFWSVSEISNSDKTINRIMEDNRKALYEHGKIQSFVESAAGFLLGQIDDADIDFLVKRWGMENYFTVSQAIQNLMGAVRKKPADLHVVS